MIRHWLERVFWDLYALCYDSILLLDPYKQMVVDLAEKVREGLIGLPKRRVLILGCGTGNLEKALVNNSSLLDIDITSVDLSRAMLKRARAKVGAEAGCRWVQADVRGQIPVGKYDVVVISNVAYTIGDGDMMDLVERLRAARDGRQHLVVSDPLPTTGFMDYFRCHIGWEGEANKTRRMVTVLLRPIAVMELVLVALVNIIIDHRGAGRDYIFRTDEQWAALVGQNADIGRTYGGLNHLIVSVEEGEDSR